MPGCTHRTLHSQPIRHYFGDMNPAVTDYIEQAPAEQRLIMEALRKLIHGTVKDVREEYKWSRPIFATTKDFAYFKTAKSHVTFGFSQASKLDDPDGRLEGTGKDMRHIKLRTMADVDTALMKKWLKALTA
jgi:hypothetical protein